MQFYQAPLEGITGYIYRNALEQVFGGVDKYFAPFIGPHQKIVISDKEKRELCPEHNPEIKLIPQIMTMDADGFLTLTKWLHEQYGYTEFNLNFGCPSGTVVSKKRGAGALSDLVRLDTFLEQIFEKSPYRISLKTRLGMHEIQEFSDIMKVYQKYPVSELIIHPRVRDELYQGTVHENLYHEVEKNSQTELVYNGNIFSKDDYEAVVSRCDDRTRAVMIGRGMVCNPAIFRQLKGGDAMSRDELTMFLTLLREGYCRDFSGETPVLYKLKEIWAYLGMYLTGVCQADAKLMKKIRKAKSLSEYGMYEREMVQFLS